MSARVPASRCCLPDEVAAVDARRDVQVERLAAELWNSRERTR
jgi:hypothetical protein